MDFISNQPPQIKKMLDAIGIEDISTLFEAVPSELRHTRKLTDDGISEVEALANLEEIANKNSFRNFDSYLGAGAYDHYVPALVPAITSRSEFLTSYTPYQPEISQGMLQAIFEFQSSICALTAMEVANASVYDAATACAEAVLMALRLKPNKKTILIAESLHPFYREVIEQYVEGLSITCRLVSFSGEWITNFEELTSLLDHEVAAFIIQSPNFFGMVENMALLSSKVKESDILFIACVNLLSCALFSAPGEYSADIAVGDCQPLGISLQFGGPFCGFMACKKEYVRQLPGRIVGETKDVNGERGFVLTLQAREQHIRREKATSNICTNQALAALASLIAILWYGPKGLRKLALTNYQRTCYLRTKLSELKGFIAPVNHFHEFPLGINLSAKKFIKHFIKKKILPGVDVSKFYPRIKNTILINVTERKTLTQLNRYIEIAKQL